MPASNDPSSSASAEPIHRANMVRAISEAQRSASPPPKTKPLLFPGDAPLACPAPELLILNDLAAGVAHEHAGRIIPQATT